MRFLLDENLPYSLKNELVTFGHQVEHARDILRGKSDAEIARYAKEHQAILITKDLEFGSHLIYPKESHCGLIIVRLPFHFSTRQRVNSLRS